MSNHFPRRPKTTTAKNSTRRQTSVLSKTTYEKLEERRLLAADVLLFDSFEDGQWNNVWVEDAQNDWVDSSQRATEGSRSAEVDGRATDATLTLNNAIDLSTYDSAELTFSWYIEKRWDSGEYVALDIFSNGSWQETERLSGNVDQENTWHHETVDLSGHMANDVKIRFRASVSGKREDANVDNVMIVGTKSGSEFSIDDVQMAESDSGSTEFTFNVTRTGDTSGAATVDYTTNDGSATIADNDYVASSGQLAFAAGETSLPVTIQVNGDATLESLETFTVELSNATSGDTILDGSGEGRILNDDGAGADEFELSDLLGANGGDGSQGAVIAGLVEDGKLSDRNTMSIIGDVNGDGLDDIVLSGPGSYRTSEIPGKVFVVFGKVGGIGSDFDLSTLDGTNGFQITGPLDVNQDVDNSWFGISAGSAGDVNGDGLGDIIVGATRYENSTTSEPGEAFVILGQTSFSASFDAGNLDGTNGFMIAGPNRIVKAGNNVGTVGDLNEDGFDDLIIVNTIGGEAHVVFGSGDFGTINASATIELETLSDAEGFHLQNFGHYDGQTPFSGDFNGDGIDDLVRGSDGRTSVLFGRAATTTDPTPFAGGVDFDLLNGSDGFNINAVPGGADPYFSSHSAGDVNADGIDDLIFAAFAASPAGRAGAGEAYVVFGQTEDFAAEFDLTTLDGTNGFYISGANAGDALGPATGIGDFNGDGIDDVLVAAYYGDPDNGSLDAGQAYVIYGSDNGFSAGIDLATLTVSQGTIFNGFRDGGNMSRVGPGSGDVNGDGRADFVIGSRHADPNGIQDAGEVYLVYGRDTGQPPVDDGATLSISNASVSEASTGTVEMDFLVTLSQATNVDVTVDYQSTDISATAGDDYQAVSGVLMIVAGDTSAVLTVTVNTDQLLEDPEQFLLTLSNPVEASLAYASGTGTIVSYTPPTKFYVVDGTTPAVYEYAEDGLPLGNYNNDQGNFQLRGVTADATGSRIWYIHKSGVVLTDDSDGNRIGLWIADDISKPEGIATNGQDIWIVDKSTDRVYFYADIADHSIAIERVTATSSFALASGNNNPRGITTDGNYMWVVNSKNAKDEVFKYTTSGSLVGRWTIDSANVNPRGITIDPSNVDHLWIVDSTTDSVYQYNGAAAFNSGSHSANDSFPLAAANSNPQGIADPPPPSDVSAQSSASPTDYAGQINKNIALLSPAIANLKPVDFGFESISNEKSNERHSTLRLPINGLNLSLVGSAQLDEVTDNRYEAIPTEIEVERDLDMLDHAMTEWLI